MAIKYTSEEQEFIEWLQNKLGLWSAWAYLFKWQGKLKKSELWDTWESIARPTPEAEARAAQVPGLAEAGIVPPPGGPSFEEQALQAQLQKLKVTKIGNQYLSSDGFNVSNTPEDALKYEQDLAEKQRGLVTDEQLEYGDVVTETFNGINYTGQYDQYGRLWVLPGGVAQPTGVAALSPQEQALATMGIFKNKAGQFVDEFGIVLGNTPDEAKARYQQKQEFEKYLSERLTPYQQEELALEKERMRLSQKPTLGEITQASIMEKQAWMSPFAAPVPWATRWSARAGGEFTPKAQAPPIQSPVLNWAR